MATDEDMEVTSCDELRLMYPFKDWEKLTEEQRQIIFSELQHDADNVCEAFNNLVTDIFKSFRDHGVDLASLKVYINTFCSTLPKANPKWLESLRACKTMAEVFCFIGEHSLWLCPTLLEAIVKKFGNESDQKKLREYQDHSLEPYLRKSIQDICCQFVMMPTHTINEYVKLKVKIPDKVLSRENITGHNLMDIQRRLIEFLRRAPGAMKLVSFTDGCIDLAFMLPKEEMEDIQSDASLSKVIGWDSQTGSFQFDLKHITSDEAVDPPPPQIKTHVNVPIISTKN